MKGASMRIDFGGDERPNGLLVHVRRHPFLYLSAMLHAATLAVLYHLGSGRIHLDQLAREQQLIESGTRLTEQARLEKRVHDMAQIKSLLEQSTGAHPKNDMPFSARPRAPDELLKEARELARRIDDIERDTKAEELARLLGIPKKKALAQVAAMRKPTEAAANIAQLEAKAREVLAQRRRQLERQQNGTRVALNESRTGRPGTGKSGGQNQDGSGAGGTLGGPQSEVLDRIAEFTNPDLPDRSTEEYTRGGLSAFFDRRAGRFPDAGAATIVKGSGRIIGRGGPYANRVYVNRWYLIGPFQGKHGGDLFSNDHHPPEQAVVLDAVYRGKGGRLLRWEYVDMARYPLIPPEPAEDAVYYGYTELRLDEEQDLTLWVGADDDAQLWLNDKLAWRGGNVGKHWFFNRVYNVRNNGVRDYNLSEGKRVLHFRKGPNKLFFKLSNGPTRLFFSLVLTK